MIVDEKPIKNWSDLSAIVKEQFKKRWIYRGVRDSKYTLRPESEESAPARMLMVWLSPIASRKSNDN